jgi:hypothetical protein
MMKSSEMFLFKKHSPYMKMMAFENEFLLLCYVHDHLRVVVVVVGWDESFIFYFSYFLSLVPS